MATAGGQLKSMLLVVATASSCLTWQPALPNPTSDTLDMTPGRHAISSTYGYEVVAWPGPEVDLATLVTPLHRFASTGDTARARKAIEDGADIDAKEPMLGLTPLQVAVVSGYVEMINMLLEVGADVSIDNNLAMTPLHVASICTVGADDMVRIEVIEILLQAGASRTATDISGAMPIAYAGSRRARALLRP